MERIIFSLLMLSALPCMAEIKDQPAALAALNSAAPKDRLDAIRFLGGHSSPEAYKAMAEHFNSEKDAYLRVKTVEAMDVSVSTWAYVCVSSAAGDTNKFVRAAAASALAEIAGNAAADKDMRTLAKDQAESVRLTLVNALSLVPSTSSVSIIGTTLADKKGPLRARRAAAAALNKMNTRAASEELIKHLSDQDPEIKAAARQGKAALSQKTVK